MSTRTFICESINELSSRRLERCERRKFRSLGRRLPGEVAGVVEFWRDNVMTPVITRTLTEVSDGFGHKTAHTSRDFLLVIFDSTSGWVFGVVMLGSVFVIKSSLCNRQIFGLMVGKIVTKKVNIWCESLARTFKHRFSGLSASCYLVVEINKLKISNFVERVVVTDVVREDVKAIFFFRRKIAVTMSFEAVDKGPELEPVRNRQVPLMIGRGVAIPP